MIRTVQKGISKSTKVFALDEKGAGGANHHYIIETANASHGGLVQLCDITFQRGVEPENGVNGCTMEDLIAICIDRLKCFQSGTFSCKENAVALTHLETALLWLDKRTQDRIIREVEGFDIK